MATPMAMPVPGIQAERDHALDWVKWLALVAMVLDHLWFVLPAEWQDPGYGLRVAGRLAFPLFCLAIAANVARQPAGFPVGIGRYLGSPQKTETQQPPTEVGGLVTYGLKVRIRVD